jgi:hypothetical protein
MWHEATVPRRKRLTALGIVIGLHALFLTVLLASRAVVTPAVESGSLTVVAIQAATVPSPAPVPPKNVSKLRVPSDSPALSRPALAAAAAATVPGEACGTLDLVMKAMVADPDAVLAVRNSPQEMLSVAQALVIWNERWSDAAISADAPLGPARAVVERTLGGMPDGCLDEQVTGPRLVPVPGDRGMMFVVIGSGVWRWRELLVPPEPVSSSADRRVDL